MTRALLVASVLASAACFDFSRFQQPGASSTSCGAMPDVKLNVIPPNSEEFQTSQGGWTGSDLTLVDGYAGSNGCFYPKSLHVCGTGAAMGTRVNLYYLNSDTANYTFDTWIALSTTPTTLEVVPSIIFCAADGTEMEAPGNTAMNAAGWQHLSVGVMGASPCAVPGGSGIALELSISQTVALTPTDCFDLNYASLEISQ
jgi:hypothetical protein